MRELCLSTQIMAPRTYSLHRGRRTHFQTRISSHHTLLVFSLQFKDALSIFPSLSSAQLCSDSPGLEAISERGQYAVVCRTWACFYLKHWLRPSYTG